MSAPATRRLPVGPDEYAAIETRFAALIEAGRDVILLQGESILALEMMARGVGAPTARALNLITSPYGSALGRWLGAAGGKVENVDVGLERALALNDVTAALERDTFDVVSVVHAEAATGALNPLAEIAEAAHAAGSLVLVDAVASIGADPVLIAQWDLDITALSAQKALGGPAGVCAVAISERAWQALARNPSAPRDSILSLLDWRERWLRAGRRQLPQIPHHLETRALGAALARVEEEGLAATISRHQRSRDAVRAGLRALGLEPWIEDDRSAAAVATLVGAPNGLHTAVLLESARHAVPDLALELAPPPLAERALRISHTGTNARLSAVLASLTGLALALDSHGSDVDVGAALAAAVDRWEQQPV